MAESEDRALMGRQREMGEGGKEGWADERESNGHELWFMETILQQDGFGDLYSWALVMRLFMCVFCPCQHVHTDVCMRQHGGSMKWERVRLRV